MEVHQWVHRDEGIRPGHAMSLRRLPRRRWKLDGETPDRTRRMMFELSYAWADLHCIWFFFYYLHIAIFLHIAISALWGTTRKSHPVRSTDATTPHHRGARILHSVPPPFYASIVVSLIFHGGNKLSWFDLIFPGILVAMVKTCYRTSLVILHLK